MAQISLAELLAQLQPLNSNPPHSLTEDSDLRTQLYHATREAMLSFESAPDPISRVAVAQVSFLSSRDACSQSTISLSKEKLRCYIKQR